MKINYFCCVCLVLLFTENVFAMENRPKELKWTKVEKGKGIFDKMTTDEIKMRFSNQLKEPIPRKNTSLKRRLDENLTVSNAEIVEEIENDYYFDEEYSQETEPPKPNRLVNITLPDYFDAREKWPNCSEHPVLDQQKCSGCWAFGIANLMSDRFCIKGKDVILSQQDILECTFNNTCCTGGIASRGYAYMIENGTVDVDCKPYDISCGVCRNVSNDCKRYKCKPGSDWYSDNATEAKVEIFLNGPIEAVFDVYQDLVEYKEGVYFNTTNVTLGVHSVEIIGWGKTEDNLTEYWLCKNSWGADWGSSGYFTIQMGNSGINEFFSACEPLIE